MDAAPPDPAAAPVAEDVDDRVGGPTPVGHELRRAGLVAIGLLAVLNVADVVLTNLVLDRGGMEMNPVADALLESNRVLVIKLLIVALLAADFLLRRPRVITLCALWLVTGVYLFAVVLNAAELSVLNG